ncbi:DUF4259 domain-containing protein [Erythrobacter sp. HKB08]|uniref:DUF4259 domain-containing protein n=1 Tax=Erythrobacter sp. HKB08 TaxID=2502843 RepID=UPI0010088751|nr:DUF4259 domain-containing protein [Erythrobacter sp. HKB08]
MGAWGAGSFENDAALDYVEEIESVDDIAGALKLAGQAGYIEADEGSRAIVAGECVAAMRGHRSKDMPDELAKKVHAFGKASLELYNDARDNLSAVMSRGELVELWAEEGSGDWNRAVTDLMERLNQPAKSARKPRKKKPQPNPSPCMFCDQPMGDEQFHMLDLTIHEDDISTSKRGGWVHLQCLNAALHPKHMIQNWQFDDELLEWVMKKLEAEREGK